MLGIILRVVLACAIWLAGVEVMLVLAHHAGLRPVLANLANPTVSTIAAGLPRVVDELTSAGFNWAAWLLERVTEPLIAQPERYLLIWSLPLVVLLMRWPVLAAIAAQLSGGPPVWLEQTAGRPGQPPAMVAKAWKNIMTMAEPGPEPILVQGIFGETSRRQEAVSIDPMDLGAWWLALMRSKGFHAGEVNLKRLPRRLRLRRKTALLIDCSHGTDELRVVLDRLDRAADELSGKPLRILVIARQDLPTYVKGPEDSLLGLRRFMKPLPGEVTLRLTPASTFVQREQGDNTKAAPQNAPPFVFQPILQDAATLAGWLASQMDRAGEFFGADGWRIVLAGALLAPAPAVLADRLLPATTDRPRRRLLFELASGEADSHESGLSIPGLLLEDQEINCVRQALAQAVDRGGREAVQRFLHELIAEAPDRANRVVKRVLQPSGAVLPLETAALFPSRVREALEAACTAPEANVEGHTGHLDILAAAASRKFGRSSFADWTGKAQLLLPGAIDDLDVEGRRALLLDAASWEGERGMAAELMLLANAPAWLPRTSALKVFLALLHNHRWRNAPDLFKVTFPDLFEMGAPWARYAGEDEDERRFLASLDVLERFFQSRHANSDLTDWSGEQRQLCVALIGPDPVLALASAWALYWAAMAGTPKPAAPFAPETIATLIQVCASPATHAAVWRRAAEALHKVSTPPPERDFVYDWAVFADGSEAPEAPIPEPALPATEMASVVAEARARLGASDARVRVAAALILSTYDRAMAGRAAAVIGRALQHPGLNNDSEYLLMLRLAQCIDRNAAKAELRRLFVEGLDSRNRAFLTLCGIRAVDVLGDAIELVPESEDEGYSLTVRRWLRKTRAGRKTKGNGSSDGGGSSGGGVPGDGADSPTDGRGGAAAAAASSAPVSWEDREIASKGHLIHKLKAKDTTGRWAYYFVLVQPTREAAFLQAIEGNGVIDIEDYGKVIASSYGEEPTEEVKKFLKEKYGFDV